MNSYKMKVALFGDCIPIGICSHWEIKSHKLSPVLGANIKTMHRISIINELSNIYDMMSFAKTSSYMSTIPLSKKQLGLNTMCETITSTDLSEFDVILICCSGGDFWDRHAVIGDKHSNDISTFYGAYNAVFNYLQQYKDKQIIFILPPCMPKRNRCGMLRDEFYKILKKLIKKTRFEYISFYDYILKRCDDPEKISGLFPDNKHPMLGTQVMMTNYVLKSINKIISKSKLSQ